MAQEEPGGPRSSQEHAEGKSKFLPTLPSLETLQGHHRFLDQGKHLNAFLVMGDHGSSTKAKSICKDRRFPSSS